MYRLDLVRQSHLVLGIHLHSLHHCLGLSLMEEFSPLVQKGMPVGAPHEVGKHSICRAGASTQPAGVLWLHLWIRLWQEFCYEVKTTPLRYLFLGSTRYYTIFWVLIRLSHDIHDILKASKIAFFSKSVFPRLATIGKKERILYFFLGTYPFQ